MTGTADDAVRADIAALEDRLLAAVRAGDVETLDELLAQHLVFTDQAGRWVGKEEGLAVHRSGLLHLERVEVLARRIMPNENSAVVVARLALDGTYGDARFAGVFAYTRAWGRTAPQVWQVVAAHCTAALGEAETGQAKRSTSDEGRPTAVAASPPSPEGLRPDQPTTENDG